MVCPNDAMFRRVKQSLYCMTVKGVEVLILSAGGLLMGIPRRGCVNAPSVSFGTELESFTFLSAFFSDR